MSKSSSSGIPRQNAEKQYQHEETDKPTKHHVYRKIITKCKFQIALRPQNRNHSEKNVSPER